MFEVKLETFNDDIDKYYIFNYIVQGLQISIKSLMKISRERRFLKSI